MKLTEAQMKQYQEEGYVPLGQVLTDDQLEGLRQEEARFRAARGVDVNKPGTHFFGKMAAYSPILREVICRGLTSRLCHSCKAHRTSFFAMTSS